MWDCKEDQETSSAKCRETNTYMRLAAISHHSSGGMSYRILDGEPGGQDALPAGLGPRYKLKPGIEYQLGQLGTAGVLHIQLHPALRSGANYAAVVAFYT